MECYYYNKDVREANRSKLIECKDVFLNKARDLDFEKPFETKYDCCVDTALEYGIDLRVMLTTNLCPAKGLANGTQCTIKDIIPEPGLEPPNCPRAIIM